MTKNISSSKRVGDPILSVKDLHKHFGNVEAVNGVSFDVHLGEVVVIVGASGSGKSTVFRCINRLIEPTAGVIFLGDVEITDRTVDINQVRSEIGMVFQSFELFMHLPVIDNITLGLVKVRKFSKSEATEIALMVLARVDMSDKVDSYPGQLSGGQKQRVAIARELAMNPRLILFDEPTSALDPELIGSVLESMRKLAKEGMTMVIVTHEIGFAKEIADWVIFMNEGIIIDQGTTEDILVNPKNKQLVRFLGQVLH